MSDARYKLPYTDRSVARRSDEIRRPLSSRAQIGLVKSAAVLKSYFLTRLEKILDPSENEKLGEKKAKSSLYKNADKERYLHRKQLLAKKNTTLVQGGNHWWSWCTHNHDWAYSMFWTFQLHDHVIYHQQRGSWLRAWSRTQRTT